jgi:hypothetical protein
MTLAQPQMNPHVSEAEFHRLLGYPKGSLPTDEVLAAAQTARDWFQNNARPWVSVREIGISKIHGHTVELADNEVLHGRALAQRLHQVEADRMVVLAASAGPEVDEKVKTLWNEGHVDESYCMNAYASAVVEQMVRETGIGLCDQYEPLGISVLSHISPGYTGWDLDDQVTLLKLIKSEMNGPLEALPSKMLVPQKSLLAVFGLTPRIDLAAKFTELTPCVTCDLSACNFRRAPYGASSEATILPDTIVESTPQTYTYTFPVKALARWTKNYLKVFPRADGGLLAHFHYEGSTCHTGGLPFEIVYEIVLNSAAQGYRVQSLTCNPPQEDQRYRSMCAFQREQDFEIKMRETPPVKDWYFKEVLQWTPLTHPAGCLCDQMNREHKWLMVLQTLHFALFQEKNSNLNRN